MRHLRLVIVKGVDIVFRLIKECSSPHYVILETAWGHFFQMNNLLSEILLFLWAMLSYLIYNGLLFAVLKDYECLFECVIGFNH